MSSTPLVIMPNMSPQLVYPIDEQTDRIGELVDGRYLIESVVGVGGIATVYRAVDQRTGRAVALKLLHPRTRKDRPSVLRFIREATVLSDLSHPNIVAVRGFSQTPGGEPYLVMELVQGDCLTDILASEGFLEPQRAVWILAQICDAMHHAHARRVLHRDLKPDNVLIRRDGYGIEHVKVLDFGLAINQHREARVNPITEAHLVTGTPAYLCPERIIGDRPPDARSDVYAIGVMAYELLCGRLPFRYKDPDWVMRAHVEEAPPRLSELNPRVRVPARLERVLRQALAKSPELRPPTAHALKAMMMEAVVNPEDGEPSIELTFQPLPPSVFPPVGRPPRRPPRQRTDGASSPWWKRWRPGRKHSKE